MLKSMQGISYAEALAERDGDAYTYMVESEFGVDIRKKLFYTMSERSWAIIGLEALGMSLEDIFITVVDKSEEASPTRYTRRARKARKVEAGVGAELYQTAEEKRQADANDGWADDEA